MEFWMERKEVTFFGRKQGQGSLLLLIHGVACDSDYFIESAYYLSKYFTVITYDRRGYSRSIFHKRDEKEEIYHLKTEDFSLEVQAEDAAYIIKKQQMGAAVVVGCSAGGMIALLLATKYPDLVKGLFLQEPPLAGNQQLQNLIDDWLIQLRGAAKAKQINRALLSFIKVIGGIDKKTKSKSLDCQRQDIENLKIFLYLEMENFLEYRIFECNEEELAMDYIQERKIFGRIQCFCVMIAGEKDKEGLFSKAAQTTAEQMNWQLIVLPGYHNLPYDQPYEFAMAVIKVVKEQGLI